MRAAIGLLLSAAVAAPAAAQSTVVADGNWRNRITTIARYDDGEVIERLTSADGRFAIHFSRAGRNAVPARDADGDGLPDQLRAVRDTLVAALAVYRERLGLRAPLGVLADPAAPLDVFLADFGGRGDGAFVEERCRTEPPRVCSGLLVLENDFSGYRYASAEVAARIVASHELFHAVQAAYDDDPSQVISEGTATWATEEFDPALDDFERALPGYLHTPDQPLGITPTTPASPFGYGSAIFFRYLSERHGAGIIRELLEAVEKQPPSTMAGVPRWLAALAPLLESRGTTFPAAFAEFARWNALTGSRSPRPPEPPAYAQAATYPKVTAVDGVLPLAEISLRMAPASARYFTLRREPQDPATRVTAAIVGGSASSALELMVVSEDDQGGHVLLRAPRSGAVDLPAGAGRHLVMVSNSSFGGNSTRVALCVGSEAEVASCAAMAPPASGTPDAGAPADGGGPTAGGDGGGCQLSAAGTASRPAAPVAVLIVLSLALPLLRRRTASARGARRQP